MPPQALGGRTPAVRAVDGEATGRGLIHFVTVRFQRTTSLSQNIGVPLTFFEGQPSKVHCQTRSTVTPNCLATSAMLII